MLRAHTKLSEVVITFSDAVQSLEPLQEAAYRILKEASCQISYENGELVCRLISRGENEGFGAGIESRFLDLVTDENLRAKVFRETEKTHDLIMALAFGSLATNQSTSA
jgi:hypothetical protein